MQPDLAVAIMEATVKIEQALPNGGRVVGTGFLVSDIGADGLPRVTLVTADHVLEDMPRLSASMGFRIQSPDSNWTFSPTDLRIRDDAGHPLWKSHPKRDVAAIVIHVPADLARRAIPIRYLADDTTFSRNDVEPGSEMMALGFPRGLASNAAGFPILRAGRIASYPIGPTDASPTFLMDFSVFPGNSGGPVFVAHSGRSTGTAGADDGEFVAGILTQQVEVEQQALGIGIVTHARFVRETIDLIDHPASGLVARADTGGSVGLPGQAVNAVAIHP